MSPPRTGRRRRGFVHAVELATALATALPAEASSWGARPEASEDWGEIACLRREIRREFRGELRSGNWDRDHWGGEILAGSTSGTDAVTVAHSIAPIPSSRRA